MAEIVRTIRKRGAINREINASMKAVMETIIANRIKKAQELDAAKLAIKSDTNDISIINQN